MKKYNYDSSESMERGKQIRFKGMRQLQLEESYARDEGLRKKYYKHNRYDLHAEGLRKEYDGLFRSIYDIRPTEEARAADTETIKNRMKKLKVA